MRRIANALREELFSRGVLLVYLLVLVTTTTEGAAQLLLPVYLDAHGYSFTLIGTLIAVFSVMRLVSRLPVGAAYAPARARGLLAAGFVGLGLATAGYAVSEGRLVPIVAFSLLHGFAFGSLGTLMLAAIIDMTGGRRAGATMAWYTAALSAGYGIGPIVGGALADRAGIPATFLMVAALPFAGLALVRLLPAFQGPPYPEVRAPGLRGFLATTARLDPRVWLAFVVVLYINLISGAVSTFFALFGITVGLTLAQIGVVKGVHSAAATAIRFASLGIMRVVDHRAINFWGVVLMGAATLVLPLAGGYGAFVAIFVVLGLCRGILRVTSAATVAELRREGKDVGIASGVYNAGLDIGAIAGPALGGVVASAVGIPLMFQLMALLSVGLYFAVAVSTRAGRLSIAFRGRPRPADVGAIASDGRSATD